MYYSKHPFLKVGLPFLSAMLFGTFFLVDLRKCRYETTKNSAEIEGKKEKRTMKSLEEELREWEEKHRKRLEGIKQEEEEEVDYEMKPVK